MKELFLAAAIALLVLGCAGGVHYIPHDPPPALADVRLEPSRDAIRRLNSGTAVEREVAHRAIVDAPGQYLPPALYALSYSLFAAGAKEEASFWFYAGQLRARFDANRSLDTSASGVVGLLNEKYGPTINPWAFQDLELLTRTVSKVLAWDEATAHDYDARWINLYSMDAFAAAGSAGPFTRPESEWQEIARETRDEYRRGFEQAMKMAREVQ